jgi:DNA gyrase subunit A
MVKKSELKAFPGPMSKTFTAVNVAKGDALGWVRATNGKDEILLVSRGGMAIRFSEEDVRAMGLPAAGVNGMRLEDRNDAIIGMGIVKPRGYAFLITENAQAKRTSLNQFPKQGRYGKGVLAWKSGEGALIVGATVGLSSHRATIQLSKGASRSVKLGDAIRRNRNAVGSELFELKEGDVVVGLNPLIHRPALDSIG